MYSISNFIFLIVFFLGVFLFYRNLERIVRNINLGKKDEPVTDKKTRWKKVLFIAFGQSKMFKKPIVGLLHLIVYLGFIIINIEVLEIVIDGLFGTHRVLRFFGRFYDFLIGSFEILGLLVITSCILFLIRRNILNIKRLIHKDLKGWPKSDANLILIFEIMLMTAFLIMGATDKMLQDLHIEKYHEAGFFPISSSLIPLFSNYGVDTLIFIERFCWWFHIIGILLFLNYLVISKHLHIIFAFPNVYFSKISAFNKIPNMKNVEKEVKLMFNPDSTTVDESDLSVSEGELFGAKDAIDLTRLQLLNAYSCTECGRCTSVCPANLTGKSLSPRKIMMDTRDRITEYGNLMDFNTEELENKTLIDDYISREEIWACTSCNACFDACPINIDPASIILDLRRFIVMEESKAPSELNNLFTNIENNGSPWQISAGDRLNWKNND